MPTNYKQLYAIKEKNKKIWLELCPSLRDCSGIYILTRKDENGFKYAYIGQAVKILSRLCDHSVGYQHIDLSIKKHKLYNKETNPTGWYVQFVECSRDDLNKYEQHYIKQYADGGYQLRNKTSGSQGVGKTDISDQKTARGYYDGVAHGEKKTKKYVKDMFEKYLDYSIKDKPNKIKERKLKEFEDFLLESVDNAENT